MQFQFESIADFFAMGNYYFYVWLSYGLAFLAVGGLIWLSYREQKTVLRIVKKNLTTRNAIKAKIAIK
ncbi:heme exporter protein CcmD [[Haemophilus] ducreyi]|uniref:Heme exporter protein D n=2 Tax=Haemophilus ducreyi TaxID=730 RepID=Q7VN09_HAEDU|nr:heme exporter protein CcmD [[Haemophilus] ducreyi]AAP95692.1 cytochrome c maturation protein D [[Haemophilus] ducreyi 35000HP]AKO30755.1 cytochrome c maturation protein D [[Haemophilus] ducreyi]AKO32193.1 cytochrome c maturation protein D [[Haemophilus] ducreyi]AKO33647.1 cytochrome c maturation protein D [[Haemophilus] ducreyi]AKO35094.1 cytochrome c maturation protein D [[Haemophilus] ducreyi]